MSKTKLFDKRSGVERRVFSYSYYIPERRQSLDRRDLLTVDQHLQDMENRILINLKKRNAA